MGLGDVPYFSFLLPAADINISRKSRGTRVAPAVKCD